MASEIKLEQLEEDWKYLVLTGVGAGVSDWLVDKIRGFLPVAVADPIMKIGVGFAMKRFLAPRFAPEFVSPIADGVMIAGFAELIKQVLSGALTGLFAKPQVQTQTAPVETGVITV